MCVYMYYDINVCTICICTIYIYIYIVRNVYSGVSCEDLKCSLIVETNAQSSPIFVADSSIKLS